jgi:hypothetical protein
MRRLTLSLAVLALLLAACGDRDERAARATGSQGTQDALPTPQRSDGPVIGMPDAPGPGGVPITGAPPAPPPQALPGEAFDLPPLEDNPETGLLAGSDGAMPTTGAGAGVPEAVALVRDYYTAINAGDFNRAYALWSDGGRNSGQSPQQFAESFAGIAGITVQIGEPGAIQAVAGGRLVEVPVSITSTGRDGRQQRYQGRYLLRRAADDGPGDMARAWRISQADVHELQP